MSRVAELVREEKALSFLRRSSLQLVLFGGKGGVGKTTASAATAVYLALKNPERKILVISTDPAHSLGDSLGCPIGSTVVPIEGLNNLWGLEVNASELMEDYQERHYHSMRKIAKRGTLLAERDVNEILALTLPGLDEMMTEIIIADSLRSGLYDLVIMDTAPTGHTLRLLALPEKMKRWAEVLDLMQEKHRFISRVFGSGYRKDDADAFTDMVMNDVARVDKLLTNRLTTEFVPVTIPETMSILETERLVNTLKDLKIPLLNIIVNRVASGRDCIFCQSRQSDQEPHLAQIEEKFSSYNLIKMPLFPYEIHGVDALAEYAEVLAGEPYQPSSTHTIKSLEGDFIAPTVKISDLLERDFQLLIFGGKGGVGKTTSAAATALHLARQKPKKKIFIFSTDPAHSLADSFGYEIGDKITRIEGNLYATEVDAPKLWAEFAEDYKSQIRDAFNSLTKQKSTSSSGAEVAYDQDVMTEMIDASPFGIDEIMALQRIIDLMNEKVYDLFILDTAPTGHLLRFLELPELVINWLKTMFKVQIRYKRILPLSYVEDANKRLLKLSRGTKMVRDALINPLASEFVAVTIPEEMAVLEMEDLLSSLKKLGIPCRHIIVNKVIPSTDCDFCAAKRQEQRARILQVTNNKSPEYLITNVELFPHQIRGLSDLASYAERIF